MSTVKKPAARAAVSKKSRFAGLRWKVQLCALILLNPFGLVRPPAGVCVPVMNCHACPAAGTYCPIGVYADMIAVGLIPWLALGFFGLIGALFGRLTCGWICPFGFLQDLMAKIPVPRWHPPAWTNKIKYVVLVVMVLMVPVLIGIDSRLFFCRICPTAATSATLPYWLGGKVAFSAVGVKLIFLAGFIVVMLFVSRGFCRLFCPMGAALAVFNRFSLFSLKFKKQTCRDCNLCQRDCPIGTGPIPDTRNPECVYCLNCVKCQSLDFNFSRDKEDQQAENENSVSSEEKQSG